MICHWTSKHLQKVTFIFLGFIHVLKTTDLPSASTATFLCCRCLYVPTGKHILFWEHCPGGWPTFTSPLVCENPIAQALFGEYIEVLNLYTYETYVYIHIYTCTYAICGYLNLGNGSFYVICANCKVNATCATYHMLST